MAKPNRSVNVDRQFPAECQWFHRLVNKRSFKITVCIAICVLNIIDLIVDWWFFISKTTIREGLVFGPPRPTTRLVIVSFCIISTFTCFLEIIQIIRDTCQNRLTSQFGQITNCLTLWLEDVPLLTLNILIVICRDGEVTYVSIAKAVIGVVASLVRFLSILLNKWLIRHDYERKDHLSQFFNTISTAGVIIVFILSTAIHIIANLPIDNFGRLHLEKPSDFQQFKFAQQKYLHQVGLFLQSPTDHPDQYIYLTDIENVIDNHTKVFGYSLSDDRDVFCIKETNQTCFKLIDNATIQAYEKKMSDKLVNYTVIFQFQQPNDYYVLGNIEYDIIRCEYPNQYIDQNLKKISFHYYRFKPNFNQTKLPLLISETTNQTYRYYDVREDFEPLEDLWRTGLSRCPTTSSYRPYRSDTLHLDTPIC